MIPGPDASQVLMAIQLLDDTAAAASVLACARNRIRPDWKPGVEPKRVETTRRHRKKHRLAIRYEWQPCSPEDVRLARDAYSRWHAALQTIALRLEGRLENWRISGISAPAEPWIKKSA